MKDNNNIDEVIRMLDNLTANEVSRIRVETSGQMEEGQTRKTSTMEGAMWGALMPPESCMIWRIRDAGRRRPRHIPEGEENQCWRDFIRMFI